MTFAVRVYDDDGYNENIRMFFRDEKLVFVWLISTRLC